MFNEVKGSFVALGDGHDPKTVAEHYGKYYDEAMKMFLKFGHYGGTQEIHENYWPLICMLADQAKRIDGLCAKVQALEYEAEHENADEPAKRSPGRPRKEMAVA